MSEADPAAAPATADPSALAGLAAPPPVDAPLPSAPPASAPNALAALHDFAPVPVSARCDGWTAEKQRAFIEALADSGSVPAAARAVGMGVEGAYRLRRRPDASAFAQAWDAAYGVMTQRLTDAAFARAIHGVTHPVFFQGEVVGERVTYDGNLARFLLERHDPRGHGYLHDADSAWAAKRDTLAPKLASLPRLLARLFGANADRPDEADAALPAPRRRTR